MPGLGYPMRSDRYAQDPSGRPSDYHDVLLARLKQLEQSLQQALGPFPARCYVDTGPLVERVYAKYAGIGWIGKNTCIIDQQLGSWLFLGVILTGLELLRSSGRAAGRSLWQLHPMHRCLSHRALVEPHKMDASLCISYLTIEKRGPIPEPLRSQMGRQVFGCDICQDVCPWNRRAPLSHDADLAVRTELVNPALAWLAELDAESFRQLVQAVSCAARQAQRLVAQRSHCHGEQRTGELPAQAAGVGCRVRSSACGGSAMGPSPLPTPGDQGA